METCTYIATNDSLGAQVQAIDPAENEGRSTSNARFQPQPTPYLQTPRS